MISLAVGRYEESRLEERTIGGILVTPNLYVEGILLTSKDVLEGNSFTPKGYFGYF